MMSITCISGSWEGYWITSLHQQGQMVYSQLCTFSLARCVADPCRCSHGGQITADHRSSFIPLNWLLHLCYWVVFPWHNTQPQKLATVTDSVNRSDLTLAVLVANGFGVAQHWQMQNMHLETPVCWIMNMKLLLLFHLSAIMVVS